MSKNSAKRKKGGMTSLPCSLVRPASTAVMMPMVMMPVVHMPMVAMAVPVMHVVARMVAVLMHVPLAMMFHDMLLARGL
jgi:hypothetical protein